MNILSWLIGRTPKETDPPPPIKGAAGEVLPVIGADATVDISNAPPVALRYTLEPFFWMIEYTDSQGVITQRRVTMRTVEERGNIKYLYGYCHERQALRMFRLDRIGCLISPDGEVEDATNWFAMTLAGCEVTEYTPAARARKSDVTSSAVSTYTAVKRHIAPGLILLTAAARSDNFLHPREMDRILRFAEDCAFDLRDKGTLPDGFESDDFAKLERTIKRLRPLSADVEQAFVAISAWPKERTKHLFSALTATAKADGRIDHIEAEFIDALRDFGTRHHGIGWEE